LVAQEVHGQHRKLERGAALQEQDAVVIGQGQEFAQVSFGLGEHLHKGFGAVADFQDRCPNAGQTQHVSLNLF
jgi:hypothetical protein